LSENAFGSGLGGLTLRSEEKEVLRALSSLVHVRKHLAAACYLLPWSKSEPVLCIAIARLLRCSTSSEATCSMAHWMAMGITTALVAVGKATVQSPLADWTSSIAVLIPSKATVRLDRRPSL
jgi:hypothetical protein